MPREKARFANNTTKFISVISPILSCILMTFAVVYVLRLYDLYDISYMKSIIVCSLIVTVLLSSLFFTNGESLLPNKPASPIEEPKEEDSRALSNLFAEPGEDEFAPPPALEERSSDASKSALKTAYNHLAMASSFLFQSSSKISFVLFSVLAIATTLYLPYKTLESIAILGNNIKYSLFVIIATSIVMSLALYGMLKRNSDTTTETNSAEKIAASDAAASEPVDDVEIMAPISEPTKSIWIIIYNKISAIPSQVSMINSLILMLSGFLITMQPMLFWLGVENWSVFLELAAIKLFKINLRNTLFGITIGSLGFVLFVFFMIDLVATYNTQPLPESFEQPIAQSIGQTQSLVFTNMQKLLEEMKKRNLTSLSEQTDEVYLALVSLFTPFDSYSRTLSMYSRLREKIKILSQQKILLQYAVYLLCHHILDLQIQSEILQCLANRAFMTLKNPNASEHFLSSQIYTHFIESLQITKNLMEIITPLFSKVDTQLLKELSQHIKNMQINGNVRLFLISELSGAKAMWGRQMDYLSSELRPNELMAEFNEYEYWSHFTKNTFSLTQLLSDSRRITPLIKIWVLNLSQHPKLNCTLSDQLEILSALYNSDFQTVKTLILQILTSNVKMLENFIVTEIRELSEKLNTLAKEPGQLQWYRIVGSLSLLANILLQTLDLHYCYLPGKSQSHQSQRQQIYSQIVLLSEISKTDMLPNKQTTQVLNALSEISSFFDDNFLSTFLQESESRFPRIWVVNLREANEERIREPRRGDWVDESRHDLERQLELQRIELQSLQEQLESRRGEEEGMTPQEPDKERYRQLLSTNEDARQKQMKEVRALERQVTEVDRKYQTLLAQSDEERKGQNAMIDRLQQELASFREELEKSNTSLNTMQEEKTNLARRLETETGNLGTANQTLATQLRQVQQKVLELQAQLATLQPREEVAEPDDLSSRSFDPKAAAFSPSSAPSEEAKRS